MQIIRDISAIKPEPCVATIGFFDGVHAGHRYLILYTNFFPVAYIVLESFAAIMSETVVITDNQTFHLITLF